MRSSSYAGLLVCTTLLALGMAAADPVAVRHVEGVVHGFLALRSMDGAVLASGDLTQNAQGDRVTTRAVLRFKDGSLYDETSVFSQRGSFRLLSNRLIQSGPSFHRPIDMSIDVATGQVSVHYRDDHGKENVASARFDLPPDVANGLVPVLLKNVASRGPLPTVSMVAATPTPRLIKLVFSVAGTDPLTAGGAARNALHYVVKVDIGGVAGLLAPMVGKQPPDTHVWILTGDTPTFLKSEGPLYYGGPIWRIELTSPVWP